jgi:ankyrin repeat protein
MEAVKLFIAKGANVNLKDDNGRTPVREAKDCGYTEIAQLLREHGAKE